MARRRARHARRTTIDRGQIEAVYDVALWTPSEQGLVTIVVGPRNAALVGLWYKDWDQGQLRALWSELGRPFSRYLDTRYLPGLPISAARQEFRGLRLPVSFVHPYRVAIIASGCAIGYLAAWITVMMVLTSD